jgi:hypothetical protein
MILKPRTTVVIDKDRPTNPICASNIIILIMAFFNVDASYKIDTLSVKRKIKYAITSGNAYF